MTIPVTKMVASALDVTVTVAVEARLTVAVSTNVLVDVKDTTAREIPFFTVTSSVLVAVTVVLIVVNLVVVAGPGAGRFSKSAQTGRLSVEYLARSLTTGATSFRVQLLLQAVPAHPLANAVANSAELRHGDRRENRTPRRTTRCKVAIMTGAG